MRSYLPLIQKDSVTYMHGLAVYVEERFLLIFATGFTSLSVFFFFYRLPSSSLCTVSGGTGRPGELCYNFSISNDLTQMENVPTQIPDCNSHSPTFLDLFISSDASICSTMAFPPFRNSDHVVVSVSIDFLLNTKRDAPFHRITYDCSCADWDGLCDHLRCSMG